MVKAGIDCLQRSSALANYPANILQAASKSLHFAIMLFCL
jgi:hypothetical protein